MRALLIALTAACSGAPGTTTELPRTAGPAAMPRKARAFQQRTDPVDVLAALSQPRVEAAAIVTGPAMLVLGGTSLQANEDVTIEVDPLEERGSDIRVGVRLDHARFAVWTARSRMLAWLGQERTISDTMGGEWVSGENPVEVKLKPGARVRRLAHKKGWTQIRYLESVEVEGWVPDDALVDVGPANHGVYPMYGPKPLMLIPGAVIRNQARWNARTLATGRYSIMVDQLAALDDDWYEVQYVDNDVRVHGFVSRRAPPGPYHRRREAEAQAPLVTNITVPAATCLYAANEPIGFVVGDRRAQIEPSPRLGWFTLTLDTPWGAVDFEARGPTEAELVKCASAKP